MHAKIAAAVALALCASSAVAQTNYSDVDIGALDIGLKTSWCNAQFDTCNTLCGNPTKNSCDNPTLNYQCTCANGSSPGLQYYTQTIPTFLCEQSYQQCIAANTMNATGQSVCNANEKADCGHLTPSASDSGSSTGGSSDSSPSSTATGTGATNAATNTASNTGAAGNSASQTQAPVSSTTSAGAAATMLAFGREIGSGVIAAGVAAAVFL